MNDLSAIAEHHQLCDELYQLAMEENRFLRQHQRTSEASLLERKRQLLEKLEQTLSTLRTIPAASARDSQSRAQLEKTRTRILQIIQLDKENEQLLLRYSLSSGRRGIAPTQSSSTSILQKIYSRCS